MRNFRSFKVGVEEKALDSFQNPIIEAAFTPIGTRLGGMSGSIRVQLTQGGYAWAKPISITADTVRGLGAEKLASDLGYKLGLPVAPVQLCGNGLAFGMNEWIALSHESIEQPMRSSLDGSSWHLKWSGDLKSTLSAMWVFNHWICDTDHNWNDGNALTSDTPDGPKICFIDYTLSLFGQRGQSGEFFPNQPLAPPSAPYSPLDPESARDCLNRIEGISKETIMGLLSTLPTTLFDPAEATAFADALLSRREVTRNVIESLVIP